MSREMETRHLALADQHIREGEGRVDEQVALIKRLESRGENTDKAEAFLALLRDTLEGWKQQRDMIMAELTRSAN